MVMSSEGGMVGVSEGDGVGCSGGGVCGCSKGDVCGCSDGCGFYCSGGECCLLDQMVVERQEHVPEVELLGGIEGQTVRSLMREHSSMVMKV